MRDIRLAQSPLVLAVAIGFLLWILVQIIHQVLWVLVVVLLALILAAAVMPIVHLLHDRRLPPRGWRIPKAVAVLMIYVTAAGFLGGMGFLVGGILVKEWFRLLEILPSVAAEFGHYLNDLQREAGIPLLVPSAEDIAAQVQTLTVGTVGALRIAGGFVEGVFVFFFRVSLVLTLAVFLVIESDRILAFWVELFPPAQRETVAAITTRIGRKIGYWVLGQVAVATTTGTLAGIAAGLLGLPFPVLVGVVTALLGLAPVVGPGLMVVPAFLLGLSQSLIVAIAAGIAFYAISTLDANVLSPLITGRAVRLSPTLVIIAIPLGVALYGAIGALIAIPVAAALQILTVDVFLPWLRARQGVPAETARVAEEKRAEALG